MVQYLLLYFNMPISKYYATHLCQISVRVKSNSVNQVKLSKYCNSVQASFTFHEELITLCKALQKYMLSLKFQ